MTNRKRNVDDGMILAYERCIAAIIICFKTSAVMFSVKEP